MKAQKTCVCGEKVHARVSQCPACSHVFYEKKIKVEKEEKPKAVGAGPGRKQCPACQEFIGVRNAKCPKCEHDFAKKIEKPEVKRVEIKAGQPVTKVRDTVMAATPQNALFPFEGAEEVGIFNGRVLVPSGKPAADLKDFSENGILTWAEKTAKGYKGGRLTYEALEYFARRFYNYPTDKVKETAIKEAFYGVSRR